MLRITILMGLLLSSLTHATIFHEIDGARTLDCTFASAHHNRIAVSGGRIQKVICPEGPFSIRLEEETGQAFIQALEVQESPVTLSVITDHRQTQDLQIIFDNRPSETLILLEPGSKTKTLSDYRFALVDALIRNRIPKGYAQRKPSKIPAQLAPGICAENKASFESAHDYLVVLELKNTSMNTYWPSERRIANVINSWRKSSYPCRSSKGLCHWVYLSCGSISSGQSAWAIVAVEK